MASPDQRLALPRLRRPSPLLILGLGGLCALGLLALAIIALLSGPVPFAIGFVLAVVPIPVLIYAVLGLDRLEPEPSRRLVLAFVWGASVAVLLAGVINTLGLSVTTTMLGAREGKLVSASIGAPIVEESLKAAVIVGFMRFGRQELDGPTDGVIYAVMVGLGFAMTENTMYYASAATHYGLTAVIGTFVLRGLVAPLSHPLFTSMTGMALGWAALSPRKHVRVGLPVLGLLVAMTLHGLWNAAASASIVVLGVYYVVILLPILIGVVAVTFLDRHRMVRLIDRHLPRYAHTGLVSPADVAMLSRLSYRRRARYWAKATGGRGAAEALRHYQLAATELALLEDRVDRGVANQKAIPGRREALLRVMAVARQRFLGPTPGGYTEPPWTGRGLR
ncbi:MAG: PrsW family intramembrane metalloprotease [Streptosporangiaceae bacterium]